MQAAGRGDERNVKVMNKDVFSVLQKDGVQKSTCVAIRNRRLSLFFVSLKRTMTKPVVYFRHVSQNFIVVCSFLNVHL